jgi:hypothetical protein
MEVKLMVEKWYIRGSMGMGKRGQTNECMG